MIFNFLHELLNDLYSNLNKLSEKSLFSQTMSFLKAFLKFDTFGISCGLIICVASSFNLTNFQKVLVQIMHTILKQLLDGFKLFYMSF